MNLIELNRYLRSGRRGMLKQQVFPHTRLFGAGAQTSNPLVR
jgi:hypothetical protein